MKEILHDQLTRRRKSFNRYQAEKENARPRKAERTGKTLSALYREKRERARGRAFSSAKEAEGDALQKQIIDKLRPYQSFGSVDDMLKAVEIHIRTHHLNESAVRVLRFISGRAKAVAGAAWLKVRTIAEAEIVGVSERTVRRALKRLSDAGIITIHRQMRDKMGGCGASIYVINPVDDHNVRTSVRAQMTGRGGDERPQGT